MTVGTIIRLDDALPKPGTFRSGDLYADVETKDGECYRFGLEHWMRVGTPVLIEVEGEIPILIGPAAV